MNAATETITHPDFSTLAALTVGDYQKWLRKAIREQGRRAEVGTVQHSPIDVFVKERTGLDILLLATDEIEVTVNGETHMFMSAPSLGYYVYSDEGEMIVTAGKALDVAMWFDPSTLIVENTGEQEMSETTTTVSAEAIENFFAAVPQMAVEKLGLSFVARCQFHGNAETTLYGIQSGEKLYTVTVHDGKITGCAHNDETCTGYSYRHTCKHTAYVEYLLTKVAPMVVVHAALVILGEFAQDLDQHVADSIASGELDEIDAERAAWAKMTPDERYVAYSNTFDLSYGDAA